MTVLHTIKTGSAIARFYCARRRGDFENLKKRSNFEVRREFILWKKI